MLDNLKILLGVSGGIAAYKSVELASKLTASGAIVKTVMTENACRLVSSSSFEGVTRSVVFTDLWKSPEQYQINHIALVDWADIVVVVPATANIIAKAANGICDDLLSTILCASWPIIKSGAAILAPAMNNNMWENSSVQRNISVVKDMGYNLVGPVEGRLACGTEGPGRMAEPQEIIDRIKAIAIKISPKRKA
jgi:phosphopantothenoylcysteine synthetase/decarboxylase